MPQYVGNIQLFLSQKLFAVLLISCCVGHALQPFNHKKEVSVNIFSPIS